MKLHYDNRFIPHWVEKIVWNIPFMVVILLAITDVADRRPAIQEEEKKRDELRST